MNVHGLLLVGILLSSFVTGLVIFFLKEEHHRLRTWLNLLGAGVKLILVAALLWGIYQGQTYSFALEFLPGIEDFALDDSAQEIYVADGARNKRVLVFDMQTGAFKRGAFANLQVRMPCVVIGGGLTAIDTATRTHTVTPTETVTACSSCWTMRFVETCFMSDMGPLR